MRDIILEEKYIYEYIRTLLNEFKQERYTVKGAKYHHNSSYFNAASICKYGILSIQEQYDLKIKDYSQEFLAKMHDNTSHVNGHDCISLSVTGLKDLYHDEFEYCPYSPFQVDFRISSSIPAARTTEHYGNEYLSDRAISNRDIKSLDIRFLELVDLIENKSTRTKEDINFMIRSFNMLRDIATTLQQISVDIPLREMSYEEENTLNIYKLSENPRLVLKK